MAMERGEVGFLGETAAEHALERGDLSGDGTFFQTRAQQTESELVRDQPYIWEPPAGWTPVQKESSEMPSARTRLLSEAKRAPAILRGASVTPMGDRIIVRYASHREGYVCETCDGSGHSDLACEVCLGLKKISSADRFGKVTTDVCTHCSVVGSESIFNDKVFATPKATGKEPCSHCHGSGLQNGSLAVPDASKQDHSFGDIVSCGPQVHELRAGDRVIFSRMAGVYMKSGEQDKYHDDINYCLLRVGEVMGLMVRK
jgi:co-chaperonin GroES (HSP10)